MAQQLASCLVCAILFFATHHATSLVTQFGNETDRQSLLSLKSMLSDDSRESLASWNDSIHFCNWPGVVCGKRHPQQRVISLALGSLGLSGSMSPAIANLTFLKKMDLSDNQLQGPIPREFGRLHRLQHLNLSFNSLEGGIPETLSSCAQLQNISICCNMLTGKIPPDLSNCSNLRLIQLGKNNIIGHIPQVMTTLSSLTLLSLAINQLSGIIPPTLWNLSSLAYVALGGNQLSGKISPSIGKLTNLKHLELSSNQLTGAIPSELWNLSSLSFLAAANNNLSGLLPTNVGELLPLIEIINLPYNQLSGSIPMSLSNASHLERIDLSVNRFSGTIPPIFGSFQNLEWLNLYGNVLEAPDADGWRFIDSLSNCTNFIMMQLDDNNLGGVLPHSIANLSTNLQWLSMGDNDISGNIPLDIGNLVSLTNLWLDQNYLLTGSIPTTVGMLQNMHSLDLDGNKLSGEIPSTLGNLTRVVELSLAHNKLSGAIPTSLGNCQNLARLNLTLNNLSGWIPKEILSISTLSLGLDLSLNSLTGPIPSEVGTLKNLVILDVSMNRLFGEIPSSIGECKELARLSFRSNILQGSIPPSLSGLRGIQELDLSQNNLSGRIPGFLQDFRFLNYLNLSFNNFEGEVPRHGIFLNTSAVSLVGNKNLCGGNPEVRLPDCQLQSPNKKHNSHQLMLIISIACSSLFFFMLFCFLVACFRMRKFRKKHIASTTMNEQENVSYADLVRATNRFSEDHKIGSGGFATVYKGMLHDDDVRRKVVAVKVLNLRLQGALKSFMAECEALRNIRHRNLVKVITACSSIDFKGDEFKALVLEFMANGSLDDWLHPKENERKMLNLVQRLDISIDVATALDYLHNYSESPIIHCDVKPSNVLLDEDMTAHVGDFGLARILKNVAGKSSSQYSTSSVGLKGTIGYVPPEYGMANRVSTQGDVYSYGILLLEMFTGKSPTDGIFSEGQSLRKSVKTVLPQRATDVIDLQLLSIGEGEITDINVQSMNAAGAVECIASVLQIGIVCSNESPAERLEMGQVIRELHKIRECFLKKLNPSGRVEG